MPYYEVEFKVGDRVKWVRDWSKLKLYTEYIGKEYIIDEIDVGYEYPYHLKEVDLWIPGVALEKVEEDILDLLKNKKYVAGTWIPLGTGEDWESSNPAQDRCILTIKRFGPDNKRYISGRVEITEDAFDELWDEYIDE